MSGKIADNKKRDIFWFFNKAQLYIVMGALIISALVFVYSLIFSTDVFALYIFTDPSWNYLIGADLYFKVQPFNKILLKYAFWLIIASLPLFIFFTHKRRKYYPSNYIVTAAYCALALFVAIYIIANVTFFRSEFLKIDFVEYKRLATMMNSNYREKTTFFDLGYVVSALLILEVIALIANLIIKTIFMSKLKNENSISKEAIQKALEENLVSASDLK